MTELVWVDRAGKPLAAVAPAGNYREPMVSPDGRQVAVGTGGVGENIWIFDTTGFDRGRRLTFEGGETPIWSPDGRWIAYISASAKGYGVFRKRADGSGQEELLLESGMTSWVDAWSPDGATLLVERFIPEKGSDLWFLPLVGERQPMVFLDTPADECHASFSPDGRLVVYVSDQSGIAQVYVETVPPTGSRWQVSRDGGDWPAFRADGKELFFAGLDRKLYAVPISSSTPFTFGAPESLMRLRTPQPAITSNRTYVSAAADGRRFLVDQLIAAEGGERIEVIKNWAPPGTLR
jgi:Tol biopolymer transport system component